MRSSLLIFGVIFLVIGGLLYFVPQQHLQANTTTIGDGEVDNRTSSANVTVPVEWAFAALTIGGILFILGLVIPSPITIRKKVSSDKVVESKKDIEVDEDNKRKIIRERTEKYKESDK